jgi:hypothetical protein
MNSFKFIIEGFYNFNLFNLELNNIWIGVKHNVFEFTHIDITNTMRVNITKIVINNLIIEENSIVFPIMLTNLDFYLFDLTIENLSSFNS